MNKGLLLIISAYTFWGTHPLYWKQLENFSAIEIFSFRSIFSFAFIAFIISYQNRWRQILDKFIRSKNKFLIIAPSLLIGSNWLIYIWSVNNEYILETSLGYFLAPLLMVLMGVVILKEKLRKTQWFAVFVASLGVIIMTTLYGQFPVYGLLLAVTWTVYGLLRKKSELDAIEGLIIDTIVVSVPAIIYLVLNSNSIISSPRFDVISIFLLIGTGIISGLPLIMFVTGSKTVNYSLIGILQYIYPTLIFMVGAFVYNEPLDEAKLIGFSFIWTALIIYTLDGGLSIRKKLKLA